MNTVHSLSQLIWSVVETEVWRVDRTCFFPLCHGCAGFLPGVGHLAWATNILFGDTNLAQAREWFQWWSHLLRLELPDPYAHSRSNLQSRFPVTPMASFSFGFRLRICPISFLPIYFPNPWICPLQRHRRIILSLADFSDRVDQP